MRRVQGSACAAAAAPDMIHPSDDSLLLLPLRWKSPSAWPCASAGERETAQAADRVEHHNSENTKEPKPAWRSFYTWGSSIGSIFAPPQRPDKRFSAPKSIQIVGLTGIRVAIALAASSPIECRASLDEERAIVLYRIEFAACVKEHVMALTVPQRRIALDAIERRLSQEPLVETRNRKPLRPNPIAPWELRVGGIRVFYEVEAGETGEASIVRILAVGIKKGNNLRIAGQEMKI